MLQPNNKKEDLKRGRTTLISGAEIRLAFAQQSCCSKNCMQKLIERSSSSTNARGGGNGRRRSSSSSASAALSHYDEDSSFDNSSFLFCQQIGIPALFYFVSKLEYQFQIFQLSNSINL